MVSARCSSSRVLARSSEGPTRARAHAHRRSGVRQSHDQHTHRLSSRPLLIGSLPDRAALRRLRPDPLLRRGLCLLVLRASAHSSAVTPDRSLRSGRSALIRSLRRGLCFWFLQAPSSAVLPTARCARAGRPTDPLLRRGLCFLVLRLALITAKPPVR